MVLIFDFDGTLADSFAQVFAGIAKVFPELGLDKLSKMQIEKYRNYELNAILQELKISRFRFFYCIRRYKKEVENSLPQLKAFGQLPETLQALKNEGHDIFLLTSHSKPNVEKFLYENNINYFKEIYTAVPLFGKDKALRKLINKYKFDSDSVAYIGDEVRDIRASKKAGVRIIAVTWGYNGAEILGKNEPDFLISTPGEILNVVSRMK